MWLWRDPEPWPLFWFPFWLLFFCRDIFENDLGPIFFFFLPWAWFVDGPAAGVC